MKEQEAESAAFEEAAAFSVTPQYSWGLATDLG